jgi:hypothetical protein
MEGVACLALISQKDEGRKEGEKTERDRIKKRERERDENGFGFRV